MKYIVTLAVLCAALALPAQKMPDHLYLRAMHDEMQRTQKELRMEGGPKPFFIVYRLIQTEKQHLSSHFGQAVLNNLQEPQYLQADVYLYAGTAQKNSSGFTTDRSGSDLGVSYEVNVPKSYDGIRRALWRITNAQYLSAATLYEKKEAYKKQKNLEGEDPDFSYAPKTAYVEEIPAFTYRDETQYQQLLNEITSLRPEIKQLEKLVAEFSRSQQEIYFLDSEGDFAVYPEQTEFIRVLLTYRSKHGHVIEEKETFALDFNAPLDKEKLMQQVRAFYQVAAQRQNFEMAQSYIGPVLLRAQGAGRYFNRTFVNAMANTKPLLSSDLLPASVSPFKDRMGLRVISPLFDVYDRPFAKEYNGQKLSNFTPIDAEGVKPQELQLVKNGKLAALPTIRSLIKDQKQSNGHARSVSYAPRAALTNVFFIPKKTLSVAELERLFLEKCKEQEMEYCYIMDEKADGNILLERVYPQDGRKEWVLGNVSGADLRSLRSISAAADDLQVWQSGGNVVAPSIILEELTIDPISAKPSRKPFVPFP